MSEDTGHNVQRHTHHNTLFVTELEIETNVELTLEYYMLHFPILEYRELLIARSDVDEFYQTSKRADRVFNKHLMHINPNPTPEEMGLTAYAIDLTRASVFHAPKAAFERLGLIPKAGDEIFYDGDRYEISVPRRLKESQIAKTNVYLEYEFITAIKRGDWGATN